MCCQRFYRHSDGKINNLKKPLFRVYTFLCRSEYIIITPNAGSYQRQIDRKIHQHHTYANTSM